MAYTPTTHAQKLAALAKATQWSLRFVGYDPRNTADSWKAYRNGRIGNSRPSCPYEANYLR